MPTPNVDTSGVLDATIATASKWLTPFYNLKTFIADMTAGNANAPVERLLWGTQAVSIAAAGTTISGVTKKYVIVDTDGSAAQNLATITGPTQGHEIVLEMANAGRVVTVKHGTGNIFLWGGADVVLSVGKVLRLFRTSTGWSDVFVPPSLATPGMVINTARTVVPADVINVTIGSIPATYQHLMLILELRTAAGTALDDILLQFNSDTTAANYYTQHATASAATLTAAEVLGAVNGGIVIKNGAIGTGSIAGNGHVVVLIKNYASTTMRRTVTYTVYGRSAGTTGTLKMTYGGGDWTNAAAAISSITWISTAASNTLAGSAYTLYGLN